MVEKPLTVASLPTPKPQVASHGPVVSTFMVPFGVSTVMSIREDLTLGIDLGIGSCGWAVIRGGDGDGEIVGLGVRTFDVPETDKKRTPTNQLRRQHRGMRRVIRRRRQRMNELRSLFLKSELTELAGKNSLKINGLDPWQLRAEGLDRRLSGPELAIALGHIGRHRGFRSNSKRDRGANAPNDASKMLKAIEETRAKLAGWRTVGELFACDPDFAVRKRNRDSDFSRSILRDDLEREVKLLFDRQRALGSRLALPQLETDFLQIAFSQRPLQDSEGLVGWCPFEPDERRSARRGYSFELFRLLSRLAALRVASGRDERPLGAAEIQRIEGRFGEQKTITYRTLRKLLGLQDHERFLGISREDEKRDFVARSGGAAEGTAALREVIVEAAGEVAWLSLLNAPETLDAIAAVTTFRDDIGSIGRGLDGIALDLPIVAAIIRAIDGGRALQSFKGAGHISAKACRAIIPHLRNGLVYSAACAAAGYDHSARPQTKLEDIRNPVAKKALIEAVKQVKAIVEVFGLPGAIHIELAREVGKSKEERDEISQGIERRNNEKDRLRDEFLSVVGMPVHSGEDLLRYELWKEQKGRCLYTDQQILPHMIVATDNSVQVDHILPWSRSGDDSFINKTLCFAGANQEKRGRTPFEWIVRHLKDEERWARFSAVVEATAGMKGRKKRNLLLKDASLLEEKFRPRNLNDTRYACSLLGSELQALYPKEKQRRIFARPGPLTDRLRRAWGIQDLKKNEDGVRIGDDRHHALDALIVAATTEGALKRLTLAFQQAEATGSHRDFSGFELPWSGFIEEARTKLANVFVSRAERRRARGEGHAATIRSIGETEQGPVVYERKGVSALTAGDLTRIKDADRNHKLIEALESWIDAGKPKDSPPLSPKGDPIRKVRIATNKKVDVLVREGAADRGEMARVDVFRRKNRRDEWEYFLVPIYPHQVFDKSDWPQPPNRAVQAYKDEEGWPVIGEEHEFLWSLHPLSLLSVEKSDGLRAEGYFRGMDRSTGAISISPHWTLHQASRGIGAKTLRTFQKFAVDRLGGRFEIRRETRTWRGAACT